MKEIEIPEGYKARINGNKVILELKESEDEKIIKSLIALIKEIKSQPLKRLEDWDGYIAWLERQKESLHISESCKEKVDSFTDEDERIRKELWEYFHDLQLSSDSDFSPSLTIDDILAYLERQKYEYEVFEPIENTLEYKAGFKAGIESEKQKEQKHPDGCFTCDEYKKGYEAGRLNGFTAGYDKAVQEQKPVENPFDANETMKMKDRIDDGFTKMMMKEQKPAERVEINKSLSDTVITELGKYNGKNYWKSPWAIDSTGIQYPLYFANLGAKWQKEQNPLTTEETELNSIAFLEQMGYTCVPPGAKPAAEWSEEDEKIMQSIIKDIEFERNYTSATTGKVIEKYNEQIDWLKAFHLSLKKKNEDIAKLCSNEWSEEDEKKLKAVISLMRASHVTDSFYDKMYLEGWLELLPKRFNLQFNQEWSEEEEKDIQEASDYLRDYANNCVQGGNSKLYVQSLADRIESLRPHPHWKPSEKQMKALYDIIPKSGQPCTLQSLHHELQQL